MQKRRTDVFKFVPGDPVYCFISNTIYIISNSLVLNIMMCFASQVGAIKLWCLLWRLYLRDRTARMIFSFWHVFSSKPLTWWLNIPINIFIALMLCYEQKSNKVKQKNLPSIYSSDNSNPRLDILGFYIYRIRNQNCC